MIDVHSNIFTQVLLVLHSLQQRVTNYGQQNIVCLARKENKQPHTLKSKHELILLLLLSRADRHDQKLGSIT